MSDVTATPLYLAGSRSFAFLHEPGQRSENPRTGVLLCPPFGWEEVCSYRSRREWAQQLASEGHAAVRIDLPGTGDSAGSARDPGRLEAWTAAVGEAATLLSVRMDRARVVAVGIGLGGMLAVRAASAGFAIDDFVLWAVPARGRSLVRELQAFSRLEASWLGESPQELEEAGELVAGGFRMSAETASSLRALDLTSLELAAPAARRVLLLGRDGLAVDGRLHEYFERLGCELEIAPGEGYGKMMDDPRWAKSPRSAFATTSAWLASGGTASSGSLRPRGGPGMRAPVPQLAETLELEEAGEAVRERPLTLNLDLGQVFAVLSEPVGRPGAGICAVLLNAGPVRRIGPNRMWVEISRRWAALGVPVVRVDMNALGDSDGIEGRYADEAAYYEPELIGQTLGLLDALELEGLPGSFVLGGLCSGAYWSFRAAEQDERVKGALMINLWCLFWSRALFLDRAFRQAPALIRKRENVEWAAWMFLRGLARAPRRAVLRRLRRREIARALEALAARETELLWLFSSGEPLLEDLVSDRLVELIDAQPSFSIVPAPSRDHTLKAPQLQRAAHQALDDALARVLAREAPGAQPADAAVLTARAT